MLYLQLAAVMWGRHDVGTNVAEEGDVPNHRGHVVTIVIVEIGCTIVWRCIESNVYEWRFASERQSNNLN